MPEKSEHDITMPSKNNPNRPKNLLAGRAKGRKVTSKGARSRYAAEKVTTSSPAILRGRVASKKRLRKDQHRQRLAENEANAMEVDQKEK